MSNKIFSKSGTPEFLIILLGDVMGAALCRKLVWICLVPCNFENYEAYFDLYRGNTSTNLNVVAKLSFAGVFLLPSSFSHDFYFLNLDALSVAPLQQYSHLVALNLLDVQDLLKTF